MAESIADEVKRRLFASVSPEGRLALALMNTYRTGGGLPQQEWVEASREEQDIFLTLSRSLLPVILGDEYVTVSKVEADVERRFRADARVPSGESVRGRSFVVSETELAEFIRGLRPPT